jgi:hypothetical protein
VIPIGATSLRARAARQWLDPRIAIREAVYLRNARSQRIRLPREHAPTNELARRDCVGVEANHRPMDDWAVAVRVRCIWPRVTAHADKELARVTAVRIATTLRRVRIAREV